MNTKSITLRALQPKGNTYREKENIMASSWTLERMHYELQRARKLARDWVSLRPVFSEIAPYYSALDGELTVVLNPIIVGYGYIARSRAPRWVREYINGRSYNATKEAKTINDTRVQQAEAYGVLEVAIIRRKGFDGYIQDELPF